MQRKTPLAVLSAAAAAVAVSMLPSSAAWAASGTWTDTATGGLWSTTGDWLGGTIANGSGFTADFSTLNITADNTVHLDSARTIGFLVFGDTTPTNNWTLDNNGTAGNILTLGVSSSAPTITVNNQFATISAVLAGTQGLTKLGTGTLTLSGTSANTYTGTTSVNAGTLVLNKTAGLNAVKGALTIGDGTGNDFVRLLASNQIADTSDVTINSSGLLDLNGQSETVNTLTLNGGTVSTGGGTIETTQLTISSLSSSTTATISGHLDMQFAQTFDVAGGTSSCDLDLQAIVTGGALTKSNSGLLQLSGNNTFGGGLIINAGIVRLANAGALNSSSPNLVTFGASSGGVLRLNGTSVAVSGLSTNATPGTPVVENASSTAATLTISNSASNTFAGVIQNGTGGGALSLTMSGGTQTLAGSSANTYTGTTTVNSGTLILNKPAETTAIPGTLAIGTSSGTAGSAVVQLQANDQIPNSSNVTINSSGRLDLNGHNDFVGSITLAGGSIATGAGVLDTNAITLTTLATSTTATISGNVDMLGGQEFNVASGGILDLDLQAAVSDGTMTKSGAGLMQLSGNNTFTGGLTINAGTVQLSNAGAMNSTTPNAVTFGSGSTGIFRLNGTSVTISGLNSDPTTPGTPVVSNGTTLAAATLTINNASDNTFAGIIRDVLAPALSQPLSITKTGAGTLTFSGSSANTYTGTTTVNAGTLILNKPDSTAAISGPLVIGNSTDPVESAVVQLAANYQIPSGTSDVTVNSSGLLDLNGHNNTVKSLTLVGGIVSTGAGTLINNSVTVNTLASSTVAAIFGNFDLFGGQEFNVAHGTTSSGIDLTVPAVLSDGSLTKSGNGVLLLSGNNTFTGGVTINAGTITLNNAGALNSTTPNAITFGSGSSGALRLNGNSVTVSGLSSDPTTPGTPVIANNNSTAATLTVNNASDNTFAGIIRDSLAASGALSLFKNGAGALTLAGISANTYTGTTTVNAGTLVLNKPAEIVAIPGDLVVGNVSGAANSVVARLMTNDQINSAGGVAIYSSGLLDLNGNNNELGFLTLLGGNLHTGTGTFDVAFPEIFASASATTATISGKQDLLGGVEFDVASGTTASGIDLDYQATATNGYMTKSGNGVLNLSGNNTFTGSLGINAGVVRLANAGALNSSSPNVVIFNGGSTGTLRLNGTTVTIAGLSTDDTTNPGTTFVENASSTAATLVVNNASNYTYSGVIQDGTGGGALSLTKNGTGTLMFSGSAANTYTGTTTVNAGTLVLNKPASTTAINGPLVIGNSTGAANSAVVRLLANFQIFSGTADVTVNSSGQLDLNGHNNTVKSLTLAGGNVSTGAGTLINNSVTVTTLASSTTASISGNFDLFGGQTFNVASGTAPGGIDLNLPAVLSDGSITKSGNGTLQLSGNNTFTGGLAISAGLVQLANAGALNSTTPNALSFGRASTGTLRLNGTSVTVSGLSSDSAIPGTPSIANASATPATLTVSSVPTLNTFGGILQDGSGSGALSITKTGSNVLTLTGANTYTGNTTVTGGIFNVTAPAITTILASGHGGLNVQGGKFVFDYTGSSDPIATIKADLIAGYAQAPKFSAGQIRDTALAAGQTLAYIDNGNAVTIMLTLPGDANEDGKVDASDFVSLSNNFGTAGTAWSQGNFNYDSGTDASDFVLLSNNFGQHISSQALTPLDSPQFVAYNDLATSLGFSPSQIAAWDANLNSVPEPGSLLIFVAAAGGLMVRRRRNTKILSA